MGAHLVEIPLRRGTRVNGPRWTDSDVLFRFRTIACTQDTERVKRYYEVLGGRHVCVEEDHLRMFGGGISPDDGTLTSWHALRERDTDRSEEHTSELQSRL